MDFSSHLQIIFFLENVRSHIVKKLCKQPWQLLQLLYQRRFLRHSSLRTFVLNLCVLHQQANLYNHLNLRNLDVLYNNHVVPFSGNRQWSLHHYTLNFRLLLFYFLEQQKERSLLSQLVHLLFLLKLNAQCFLQIDDLHQK